MTANNPIAELLGTPLGAGWTIDGLAEQLLHAIAAQECEADCEFAVTSDTTADPQTRRLLRPLIACLVTKAAAEAGTPADLYGGRFTFERPGHRGPVWILGEYVNRPGSVRVALRRSESNPVDTASPISSAAV